MSIINLLRLQVAQYSIIATSTCVISYHPSMEFIGIIAPLLCEIMIVATLYTNSILHQLPNSHWAYNSFKLKLALILVNFVLFYWWYFCRCPTFVYDNAATV